MSRETEIFCEGCKGYLRVDLPVDVNGLHKIICPKCKHVHYRCVEKGVVTEDRYSKAILERVSFRTEEYKAKWYPQKKRNKLSQVFQEVGTW